MGYRARRMLRISDDHNVPYGLESRRSYCYSQSGRCTRNVTHEEAMKQITQVEMDP
jgi:hypothetical protein